MPRSCQSTAQNSESARNISVIENILKSEEKTVEEAPSKMPSTVDELFSQIANMFDDEQQGGEMQLDAQQGGQMSLDTPSLVNTVLSFDEEDDNAEKSQQLLSAASPFCFPASVSPAPSSSSDQQLLSPNYFSSKRNISSSSPSPSDSDYESLGCPDSPNIVLDNAFDINLEQDSLDQLFPSLLCPENY